MKPRRSALLVLLWLAVSVAHAKLTAQVETTTIATADTLRLTLRADGTNLLNSPDFDPLLADFDILSTARSSQMRSLNGTVEAWTTWDLLLKPKHGGTLQVPALRLGSEESQPIQITAHREKRTSTPRRSRAARPIKNPSVSPMGH